MYVSPTHKNISLRTQPISCAVLGFPPNSYGGLTCTLFTSCVFPTFLSSIAVLCLRLRLKSNHIPTPIAATRTSPPRTPPTIGPTGEFLFFVAFIVGDGDPVCKGFPIVPLVGPGFRPSGICVSTVRILSGPKYLGRKIGVGSPP